MKKDWRVGDTVYYPQDYNFEHVMDVSIDVALVLLKELVPNLDLGFIEKKVKDITINNWQKCWYNKLLIVIGRPHLDKVVGLYNADGNISLQIKTIKDMEIMKKVTKNIKFHILHGLDLGNITANVERKICLALGKGDDFRAMTSTELFCKTCPLSTDCEGANWGHDSSVKIDCPK